MAGRFYQVGAVVALKWGSGGAIAGALPRPCPQMGPVIPWDVGIAYSRALDATLLHFKGKKTLYTL